MTCSSKLPIHDYLHNFGDKAVVDFHLAPASNSAEALRSGKLVINYSLPRYRAAAELMEEMNDNETLPPTGEND